MQQGRRKFIASFALSSLSIPFAKALPFIDASHKHTIGLLLGTVEKYMTGDAENTLRQIADMGYKELEYPRTYGYATEKLKSIIKANNLVSLGGGNTRHELTTNFGEYVKEYNELGKKYVFCYWPWLDGGKNITIDDWKKNAEEFNRLGKMFRQEGLTLAYHNHDIEFIKTEEQIPYDIFLQNTDPELLSFQMDIWWIRKGGSDPLQFINQYPGRFPVCHIKTAGLLAGNEEVIPLDYKPVLEAHKKAGFRHFILENEPGIDKPFQYFKDSYPFIKKLL